VGRILVSTFALIAVEFTREDGRKGLEDTRLISEGMILYDMPEYSRIWKVCMIWGMELCFSVPLIQSIM